MSGDKFRVNSLYGDPINGSVKLAESTNPLYGYYGYVRIKSNGEPKKHKGYDYYAEVGTDVLSVGTGDICQIRIGKYVNNKPYYCKQTKKFADSINNKLFFSNKDCSDCQFKDGCYGIQVWLKLKNDKYAYYAHLSNLSEKLFANVIYNNKDAITFQPSSIIMVELGDKIGESGRTGNACDEKEVPIPHLHFECRTTIEQQKNADVTINPNAIIKTGFYFIDKDGYVSDRFEKEDKKEQIKSMSRIHDLEEYLITSGLCTKNNEGEFEMNKDKPLTFEDNIQVQSKLGQIIRESSVYKLFKVDQVHLI